MHTLILARNTWTVRLQKYFWEHAFIQNKSIGLNISSLTHFLHFDFWPQKKAEYSPTGQRYFLKGLATNSKIVWYFVYFDIDPEIKTALEDCPVLSVFLTLSLVCWTVLCVREPSQSFDPMLNSSLITDQHAAGHCFYQCEHMCTSRLVLCVCGFVHLCMWYWIWIWWRWGPYKDKCKQRWMGRALQKKKGQEGQ